IDLLELGLGKPMPPQTKALILKQPSIRIASGIVLEFSSPAQLKQLRRQPVFRKYIDEFLSPQRVLVSIDKKKGLFEMLNRRGVYMDESRIQPKGRKKRTHFPYKPKTILQPVGKMHPKLSIIENYKELGQALDILYRTPGYPAEQRRITPMSIEERGGKTYVIAWCQTRRAQRTFRLDRMQVPGTW
ncbi:MAG TPA: WYL domain-containing protein, partial [Anaerolineales bacterium]|nr:WYL domain-containing protein [Anaerolineales bacterium]